MDYINSIEKLPSFAEEKFIRIRNSTHAFFDKDIASLEKDKLGNVYWHGSKGKYHDIEQIEWLDEALYPDKTRAIEYLQREVNQFTQMDIASADMNSLLIAAKLETVLIILKGNGKNIKI